MPKSTLSLPREISSRSLRSHAAADETICVVLETKPNGSFNAWRFRAQGSRVVVFDYDTSRRKHCFRCPLSVWEAADGKLAREIFESSTLRSGSRIIPRFEVWKKETESGGVLKPRFGNVGAKGSVRELPVAVLPESSDEEYQAPNVSIDEELGELAAVR